MSIKTQADDFFNAYLVLKENNEAMIERLANSPGKTLVETKRLSALPAMGVDIVCLAFSVELYIKNVHCAVKGKAPRGHDILILFEELPEQIQQVIFTHPAITKYSWSFDEFKRQIEAISDGFEKWRYSHEVTSLRYNNYFALVFIESLRSAAGDVRKWSEKSESDPVYF